VSVVTYPEGSCSATGVTLRRAMGRLGEQNYNLLFNNCEHFAHWCKTGRHRSGQVENWLHTGSLGALAIGQWLPAAALAGARVLVRQGVPLEEGLERVRRSLRQLEELRQTLQTRLDEQLARAESRWGQSQFESLRRAAQKLADQLAEVEDLEDALENRLQWLLEGVDGPRGLLEPGRGGSDGTAGVPQSSGPAVEP
jgi:hypothetical protein